MDEKRMIRVTVDGTEYSYPHGTPYRTIAADFQDRYPCDILLVNRDGKLCELHKPLDRDCSLRMITAQDVPGIQTYERSALFLILRCGGQGQCRAARRGILPQPLPLYTDYR